MAGIRLSRASFATFAAAFAVVCVAGDARAAGGDFYVTFNRDHSISFLTASGTFIGTTSGTPTQLPAGSYNFHFDNTVGVSCPSFTIRGPGTNFTENLTCGEYPSTTLAAVLSPNTTTWPTDWLAAGEQPIARASAAPRTLDLSQLDLKPDKLITPPSQMHFVSYLNACLAGYIKV